MRQALSSTEKQAIRAALEKPEFSSGLKKFCQNQDERYSEKVRDQQNLIPEDLHQKAKKEALAALYGGMSKAYGTMFAEIEKAAEE